MTTPTRQQTLSLPDGRVITLESGLLAQQADGAVLVRMGDAALLATAVVQANEESPGYLPLVVDYQERYGGAGKIPGGILRREGRLNEHEILTSRLVDRILRPRISGEVTHTIQVQLLLLAHDAHVDPVALAPLAASVALSCCAELPFRGPIASARIARVQGEWLINPSPERLGQADLALLVGADEEQVLMVEGEMKEASEEELLEAVKRAHEVIGLQCQAQQAFLTALGLDKGPVEQEAPALPPEEEALTQALYKGCYEVVAQQWPSKKARSKAFQELRERYLLSCTPEVIEAQSAFFNRSLDRARKQAILDHLAKEGRRMDGRTADEIRPIQVVDNYLSSAHGSALFMRGETQALATVALGSKRDEQLIDTVAKNGYRRLMLHYNFPGFSTGEARPNRGPGRREIGHGHVALRALRPVLPPEEELMHTTRFDVVILTCNGSSSMATICASSLAAMDAGIQIKRNVAGVAIGRMGSHLVVDILGEEDQAGNLDLKVAGTTQGITACQMDIKEGELTYATLALALQKAKEGRLHILKQMDSCLATPRTRLKAHAPAVERLVIAVSKIGAVIGPGGKVIQELQRESGATISITEDKQGGHVEIFAPHQEALAQVIKKIKALTEEPRLNEVYLGKVKSIKSFGAFVEFLPGKDGLLHISQVSHEKIDDLEEELKIGQELKVKLVDIHPRNGKFSLSRKALFEPLEDNDMPA